MAGIVQGSYNGPKYIYGKLNVNHQGAKRAAGNEGISGSKDSARADFATAEFSPDIDDEIFTIDEAGMDTPLKNIDFDEVEETYASGDRYELNREQGHAVYLQKEGSELTMFYEFEDDPRRSILSMLDGDVDRAEEFEFDPFGSDEDVVTDEYFDAYSSALNTFAEREGISLDQEILESDYGRLEFYHSVDLDEDGDMSVGQLHDHFNGAYNNMTYRFSDSIRADFERELEERGISTGDLADKLEEIRAKADVEDDDF